MGKTLGVVVVSIILILLATWLATQITASTAAAVAAATAPATSAASPAAGAGGAAGAQSPVASANPATAAAPATPPASGKGQAACQPVAGAVMRLEGCRVGESIDIPGLVFDYKKTALGASARVALHNVAADLKAHRKMRIELDGFTDAVASTGYNQGLALARARAVKAYLVAQGIAPSRMVARGVGKAGPVGDNGTDAGRALNRRVGITLLTPG